MAINYTREIIKQVKDAKLSNAEEKAFADLLALGWSQLDAFITAFSPNRAVAKEYVENRIRTIMASPSFKSYLIEVSNKVSSTKPKPELTDKERADIVPLTKEQAVADLTFMYRTTVDSIQKRDIIKQLADLTGMKREIIESDNNTKKYYLPRKCSSCSWNKSREADRID